jgi:NADP-dependent 3-hydroxy acid dehydrogenase YdfG
MVALDTLDGAGIGSIRSNGAVAERPPFFEVRAMQRSAHMTKSKNIEGKVVVITGGSSGMGAATSRYLAARGAKIVMGDRTTDRLEKLAQELRSMGAEALGVTTDVTRREKVEALVGAAVKSFGRIDVMINNAGLMALAPIDKLNVEEWDRMIDVNIKGVLYGIAAALPHMKKQKSGHIVNVASVVAHKIFVPGGTVYSATKFAVRALSEGLRAEAPDGIRTTIISPGAIRTNLMSGTTDKEAIAAVSNFYESNQIPPEVIANAIAYAIAQPAEVDVNEIVVRPTVQEF